MRRIPNDKLDWKIGSQTGRDEGDPGAGGGDPGGSSHLYLQAGMQEVPDADVKSAAEFLRKANMMELRQLLKRKYAEGKAFGMYELFKKARAEIGTARAANLESQKMGEANTK